MANFTLKQLRYFEALSRHLHFGDAAEECAVSQPALSLQIKELEAAVGQVLVERAARGVRLTRFGHEFLRHVQGILQKTADLSLLCRSWGEEGDMVLRLGIIPTIAPYLLGPILTRTAQDFPAMRLLAQENVTSRLVDSLHAGDMDVAVVALPVEDAGLSTAHLFAERFYEVHPLNGAGDNPLLLLESGHCLRDNVLGFCGKKTAQIECNSLSTLVHLVRHGVGHSYLPEMALATEAGNGGLKVTETDPPVFRDIGLIWRKTSPLGPLYEKLAERWKTIKEGG